MTDSGIPRIRIVRAVRTCLACPSQWVAYTDDERPVHLRFRHGTGRVEVDFVSTEYVEPYGWPSDQEGDLTRLVFKGEEGMDGFISLEDFCRLANIEMAPDLKETSPYVG